MQRYNLTEIDPLAVCNDGTTGMHLIILLTLIFRSNIFKIDQNPTNNIYQGTTWMQIHRLHFGKYVSKPSVHDTCGSSTVVESSPKRYKTLFCTTARTVTAAVVQNTTV